LATQERKKKTGSPEAGAAQVAVAVFDLFARAIDRFGWPGGTVLLLFTFTELHGTDQQKHEIIDMLIHPDSPGGRAIGILVLLVTGIFVAQHHYWKRKMQAAQQEIRRLAEWKTEHQQKLIPVDLHHTAKTGPKAAPKEKERR
jgi:hypothetical protein